MLEHAKTVAYPDPQGRQPAPALVVDLATALTGRFAFDAHTAQYVPAATLPVHRLKAPVFDEGGAVDMRLLLADFDDPVAHASGEPASDEWRHEFAGRCEAIEREHPEAYGYWTRGGARLLWTMPAPETLSSLDDCAWWTVFYGCVCDYLLDRFGLCADKACGDWGRLFRLPHATRRGNSEPDDYGDACGDPRNVGAFEVDVSSYVGAIAPRRKSHSSGYAGPFEPTRVGVMATMLEARGDLGRQMGPGKWACRCPASEELGDHGLDSSAFVAAPSDGKTLGWIHCSHARCEGWRGDVQQMLAWFTAEETEAATRRVFGLARKAGAS